MPFLSWEFEKKYCSLLQQQNTVFVGLQIQNEQKNCSLFKHAHAKDMQNWNVPQNISYHIYWVWKIRENEIVTVVCFKLLDNMS